MEMTPRQIASEFRTGKDKHKTIKVLAELNAVTQREIAQILADQGEEIPKAWRDKLSEPLKRPPRGKPVSAKEIGEALLETLPTAEVPEPGFPAPVEPAPANAALSLDEIRQAALALILEYAPGEPVRFHGYALGVAALVQALEEKAEGKR